MPNDSPQHTIPSAPIVERPAHTCRPRHAPRCSLLGLHLFPLQMASILSHHFLSLKLFALWGSGCPGDTSAALPPLLLRTPFHGIPRRLFVDVELAQSPAPTSSAIVPSSLTYVLLFLLMSYCMSPFIWILSCLSLQSPMWVLVGRFPFRLARLFHKRRSWIWTRLLSMRCDFGSALHLFAARLWAFM